MSRGPTDAVRRSGRGLASTVCKGGRGCSGVERAIRNSGPQLGCSGIQCR
jgi:hypothetical protein